MTFDDDYVQLRLSTGPLRLACKLIGLDWPPPEFIDFDGPTSVMRFERMSFSQITDAERAGMHHVCRGAEYIHAEMTP